MDSDVEVRFGGTKKEKDWNVRRYCWPCDVSIRGHAACSI
jgi:hypothetical protein